MFEQKYNKAWIFLAREKMLHDFIVDKGFIFMEG